ncbi:MAG: zinc ribbon domain-containing protein [Acidiferrobacterales bacterium]|nr:zinc ribbon domain-containing protein [Acidiferrobacterales bacterium]
MPIYEYQCQACGHEMEAIQKLSDPVLKDCPECGKPDLKKLVSAAGFQLKGSGWYETDFKGGGNKKKKDSGSESKSAAGTGGCASGACGCASGHKH